ncbi:hypothetical protein D3C75_937120 [compost metagenome]
MNNEHQPHQRHENAGHLYCRHFLAKQQYSPDDREKSTELQEQRCHAGTDAKKHAVVHQPAHSDTKQQTVDDSYKSTDTFRFRDEEHQWQCTESKAQRCQYERIDTV